MDRQDIDALLIGALYGELTPAEEARLTSHLESHPTDRGALDDLKTARQAVRESRIFELQLDPPQHLSALLLQEAHRRAPKRVVASEENPSWFVRFTRSFIAHPAMAAAATLVLVLGVAGTLYMKKGSDFATKKEMAAPAELERDRREAIATPSGADTGVGEGAAAGSAAAAPMAPPADEPYKADLYDKNAHGTSRGRADDGDLAERKQAVSPSAKAELAKENASDRWGNKDQAKADQAPSAVAAPQKKSAPSGIVVGSASPQPKDFEQSNDNGASGAKGKSVTLDTLDDTARNTTTRAGAGGGANAQGVGTATTSTGSTNSNLATVPKSPPPAQAPGRAPTTSTAAPSGPYAQPPPPPPAAPSNDKASVAQKAPSTTSPSGGMAAPKAEPKPAEKPADEKVATKAAPEKSASAKRDDSSLLAWAKGQHDATLALVRKGDCTSAAKRALDVSNRAPEYYAQYMASDRNLKSCMAYINAERDKDAEKSGKSRAQKRVNSDEVQSAPAPSR